MKNLSIIFIMVLLIALAFVSCVDDDDDDSAPAANDDDTAGDDDDDDIASDDDDDDTTEGDEIALDNGTVTVVIHKEPFGLKVLSDVKGTVFETLDYGEAESLWYTRSGDKYLMSRYLDHEVTDNGASIIYLSTEGIRATVNVSFTTDNSVKVTMSLEATHGWLFWGQDIQLQDDEAVYGAVERIHWWYDWSEGNPREIGSLDRRGQYFPMVIMATIGAYVPFYQTSSGYGLFVDTTFYGFFDFGYTIDDRLRFFWQTTQGKDPVMTYYIFYGPGHDKILDEYTAVTGRPFIPPDWAFKHWRWRDDHHIGEGLLDGNIVNGELAEDINEYDNHNIPVGNYLIDRPWSPGDQGFEEFTYDPVRFPNEDLMRQSLFNRGYHLMMWGAPWAIGFEPGQNGYEADQFGYHAPHQKKHIDFTNPDAYEWWKGKVRDFALAKNVHAWKLDRGEEDQPSLWWDIYHDGRSGAEIRNQYPLLYHACYFDAMNEAWDGDFVMILRTSWAGTQKYGVIWGGDTKAHVDGVSTDLGLRSAIISQLHCAFMGIPFWGSDTGGYREFVDREVFARWLQFSAFSALMEIGGNGTHAPWDMPTEPNFDQEMIDIYRTYTQLHHDLIQYMSDYANTHSVKGAPMTRPLVFDHPDDPNVKSMWDQYYFGHDILVAPVWKTGERQREVYIPEGQFVDYWDDTKTYTGPTTITADAPMDRIPFYIRKGTNVLGKVW